MFGTYRLLLACMVALSHFGFRYSGFNPGQWAVLAFYLLSGFLMTHQWKKLSTSGSAWKFYLDRFLRVYPLYIALVIGTCIFSRSYAFWLQNVALIPLNYSYFTKSVALIGPSWSLACESQYYLLVPLFGLLSTKSIRLISSGSLALFCASPILPASTFWAYIGLPGVLFSFLTGVLLARRDYVFLKCLWTIVVAIMVLLCASKAYNIGLPTGIHINVCIGYLAAVPSVVFLSKMSPKYFWDRMLGLLSYPLFLSHELVKASFFHLGVNIGMPALLFASLLASTLLAVSIEKPFDLLRYRIR